MYVYPDLFFPFKIIENTYFTYWWLCRMSPQRFINANFSFYIFNFLVWPTYLNAQLSISTVSCIVAHLPYSPGPLKSYEMDYSESKLMTRFVRILIINANYWTIPQFLLGLVWWQLFLVVIGKTFIMGPRNTDSLIILSASHNPLMTGICLRVQTGIRSQDHFIKIGPAVKLHWENCL